MKSIKIKVLRNTTASGEDLNEGESCEVSEQDAILLVNLGKAELVEKKGKSSKGNESAAANPPPSA